MWQLPSAEFQKAEIVFNPPNIGTNYKELRMPIILGKQMDILNHKHLRTTQMLQFYLSPSWCPSILMRELAKTMGEGREGERFL